jgi:hypothetical protein
MHHVHRCKRKLDGTFHVEVADISVAGKQHDEMAAQLDA